MSNLLKLLAAVSAKTFEVFIDSGMFTVPNGVTSIDVYAIGGGGGGDFGDHNNEIYGSSSGGGAGGSGSGQYAVTPGQQIVVTVGNGGDGGRRYATVASDGGDTIVGSFITAGGGEHGIHHSFTYGDVGTVIGADTIYVGGHGYGGNNADGGGGGSAGCAEGSGNDAFQSDGGAGVNFGYKPEDPRKYTGNGGDGGQFAGIVRGFNAGNYGGGGGGGGVLIDVTSNEYEYAGGNGSQGIVFISWPGKL